MYRLKNFLGMQVNKCNNRNHNDHNYTYVRTVTKVQVLNIKIIPYLPMCRY